MAVRSYLPLKGKVDYDEVSTPVSTEWFSGYQHGELYGLDHTAGRLRQEWLGPCTKIPDLWLAGKLTTMAMVGMRKMTPLMKKIYS